MQIQDSPLFESAYFILRRKTLPKGKQDMVAEANRIIGTGNGPVRAGHRCLWRLFLFLGGALCGATLGVLLTLLFGT